MAVKIFNDGFRLVIENTDTRNQTILNDRRIGFVFPGVRNPGYILVMGLLDEPTLKKGEKVVLFLKEIEEKDKERFFELLIIWSRRYKCKYVITSFDKKNELVENAFLRFKKSRNVKGIYLMDSKDFSGFEEAAPIINELGKKGNLRIPKNTVLNDQLSKQTAADLKSVDGVSIEERHYAVNALNHVISSWEYFPFSKPKKKAEAGVMQEGYR